MTYGGMITPNGCTTIAYEQIYRKNQANLHGADISLNYLKLHPLEQCDIYALRIYDSHAISFGT